jgi:uncharacterized HAD superfamily protein
MNYRSIGDMASLVSSRTHIIDLDVDLIVGIPRSGMLAASILALHRNIKFCDINSFINNTQLTHGFCRKVAGRVLEYPLSAKKVLVIDDSVDSGRSMSDVKRQLSSLNLKGISILYAAIYATKRGVGFVDYYFEKVAQPRLFEWNILHRKDTKSFCFDIDGILCRDPTNNENDDGMKYIHFMDSVEPLVQPTYELGYLVTSRLEKYRPQTEDWLTDNNIKYNSLYMLDLPSGDERRRLACHSDFKAQVYNSIKVSSLFIESDLKQSVNIAKKSGKYCLCLPDNQLIDPNLSFKSIRNNLTYSNRRFTQRIVNKIKRIAYGK